MTPAAGVLSSCHTAWTNSEPVFASDGALSMARDVDASRRIDSGGDAAVASGRGARFVASAAARAAVWVGLSPSVDGLLRVQSVIATARAPSAAIVTVTVAFVDMMRAPEIAAPTDAAVAAT